MPKDARWKSLVVATAVRSLLRVYRLFLLCSSAAAGAASSALCLHFGSGTIVWALFQPANHVGLQREKGKERKPPL